MCILEQYTIFDENIGKDLDLDIGTTDFPPLEWKERFEVPRLVYSDGDCCIIIGCLINIYIYLSKFRVLYNGYPCILWNRGIGGKKIYQSLYGIVPS